LITDVREFMLRMKAGGRAASTEELLSVMRGFKDNVTLDHLYRDQLVAMAQFLNMNHFAPTAILRFQLRQRLKRLRNEDKEIHWEGVGGLSEAELKADLRNRGLPTTALSREAMQGALKQWVGLSQVKEIPYSLLILTNMMNFAGTRHDQKEAARLGADVEEEASIPLAAAQAAMSSLPTEMAAKSSLVEDVTNDEKLEALRREEELVEEERLVFDSAVGKLEDRMWDEDQEDTADEAAAAVSAKRLEVKKAAAEGAGGAATAYDEDVETAPAPTTSFDEALNAATCREGGAPHGAAAEAEGGRPVEGHGRPAELTREQIADLAEAIDTMIDSPIRLEKEEMAELEADRIAKSDIIEEAKCSSRQVAMLDSRVQSMLQRIKAEMEQSEISIGEAFHKLDLDGDGMLSHRELLDAVEELSPERRPDTKAFEDLLEKMDLDHDGQISVAEVRKLMKGMREVSADEDDEDDKSSKKAAGAAQH